MTTNAITTEPTDANGNRDDNDDVGSHDSTLDSMTSEGTVLERQDDVTVSDNAFIIDPHRTLSVSGDVVVNTLYCCYGNLDKSGHHGN